LLFSISVNAYENNGDAGIREAELLFVISKSGKNNLYLKELTTAY
jgi:hypothetical protein